MEATEYFIRHWRRGISYLVSTPMYKFIDQGQMIYRKLKTLGYFYQHG